MTNWVQTKNGGAAFGFRNFFKPRDIFFHDGQSLRRISVGVPIQTALALVALALILWSGFATARFATAPTVDPAEAVRMARMEQKVAAMQADVQMIKTVAERRYKLTVQEVRKLGLDPKRFTASKFQGQGGPFEAVEPLKTADPKFKQLFTSWKKLDQIERGTIAIPSTQPVTDITFTSGFGVRSDPFRGRAAMHGGVDLAGPIGTEIHATADGVVERAGYTTGGYGNLVELDHGHGIETRYGHMSKVLVEAGQRVKRGDVIGLMGSTGRSTGSHLHYEVRIDGKAVNPIPFMQGNEYLLAVQRRAAAATKVAMGGPSAGGSK